MIERTKYLNQLINRKIMSLERLLLVSADAENLISLRICSHSKDPIQKILVVNKPFKEMRDPEGYVLIGIADFLLSFIK